MSEQTENTETPKSHKKAYIWTSIILAVLLIVGYSTTGFIVIQPIGALPEGTTIWYVRAGYDLPFITSPDGYSLDKTGSVSLMSRMGAISALMDVANEKKIARFPYSDSMYLKSTGGQRFTQ